MKGQISPNSSKKKQFYTIGQVSETLGLKEHVLRFWEKTFEELNPLIAQKGNRRKYTEHDIKTIKTIKRLLYDEGFTVHGAKKKLSEQLRDQVDSRGIANVHSGNNVIKELLSEMNFLLTKADEELRQMEERQQKS